MRRSSCTKFEIAAGRIALDNSRRTFLTTTAAAVGMMYVSGLTPQILAQAHEHAKSAPRNLDGQPFKFFTPQQAADFEAFASQIFPTDETPGAKEANVVHFVDFALTEIDPYNKEGFTKALNALNDQARKTAPSAKSFAALTPAQQIEAMKAIEKTDSFGTLKFYTVAGFFSDPADGGNKDQIGWKLIGFEDSFYYAPPFGWYDAQAMKEKA
jgi:gluconate 2-dehydrogenase gamma chain